MSEGAWTPYGLEAIRVGHLRRRRAALLALIFVGAIVWLVFAPTPTNQNEIQIFANGNRVGSGNGLQIEAPPEERPVTVSIQPGKITHASAGSAPAGETVTRTATVPVVPRAVPVPYAAAAFKFGPFLLLALALWALGKRKPTSHMVNYGIYKGALPLELISASAAKRVFTTRKAGTSIFGKSRSDYLPAEVERVPQEGDA